jgi:hypothetical protein
LAHREQNLAVTQPPLPPAVVASLAAWWLFENVPLPALVPDPQLLPQESLRFFVVDRLWQRSLVAGAFSVGRSASDQLAVDAQALAAALPAIAGAASPVLSGCLLRSGVVKGWPTMRIVGTGSDGTALTIVRRAMLADTLLLVLFAGSAAVGTVVFSEPAEAVHFGVDTDEDTGKPTGDKTLRAITGTSAGNPIAATVPVAARPGGALDVAALAGSMSNPLNENHANDDGSGNARSFTAREFAVEMIKGVQSVTVSNAPAVAT